MRNSFWFKSSELKVIPGEDEETNPFASESVAKWIANSLDKEGFDTSVYAEDWGWRVDCLSNPYIVWIGCGNMDMVDDEGNLREPDIDDLTWQCFIEVDKPFFKSLFRKFDPSEQTELISTTLTKLLEEEPHITIVEEP